MRNIWRAVGLLTAVVLTGCGGGGGGSDGSVTATPPAPPAFPTLVQSAGFTLPSIEVAPERPAVAGAQQGRVLAAPGTYASAVRVDWLDASDADAPRVIATTLTDSSGAFALPVSQVAGVAATDLWLRATLHDATELRAFATHWTEVSVGTEAAVREIARLRKAGAFTAHPLTTLELAQAQESLGFVWLERFSDRAPTAAVAAMVEYIRFLAPWNRLLDKLALAGINDGAGDVAGLMPLNDASWLSTVTRSSVPGSHEATFRSVCHSSSIPERYDCSVQSPDDPDLGDQLVIQRNGIRLRLSGDTSSPLGAVLSQLNDVPLLEFPQVPGTRVLIDNPQLVLLTEPTVHAAVKITRRTYQAASVQALGRSVQAVQVVLDYEIALLNTASRQQVDVLARERRWFSPQGGRVRVETIAQLRTGAQVITSAYTIGAESVSGAFFLPPVPPFAGVADVRAIGLRHRHAVFSAARGRIYVAADSASPQILELEPATLATVRVIQVPSVAGRLAVSADGQRLYAGLDGGQLVEWQLSDMSQVRQTMLPTDPDGRRYITVYDLAVDPFDPARVLVLAGGVSFGGSGAVLLYREGVLTLRDAPRYYATDYGWGYYSLNAFAWSSVRDEYLAASLGSPKGLYRFRVGTTATTDVSMLQRVDDLGWRERDGIILTDRGALLDATSFATVGSLGLGSFGLTGCSRLEAATDLCEIAGLGVAPPFFVQLNHATGAFLGTYRPAITEVTNGCDSSGVREGSLGLDDRQLTPMGDGRSLVSTLTTSNGSRCSLQVWSLHGAYR